MSYKIQIGFIADLPVEVFLGIGQGRVGAYPTVKPAPLNSALFPDPVTVCRWIASGAAKEYRPGRFPWQLWVTAASV